MFKRIEGFALVMQKGRVLAQDGDKEPPMPRTLEESFHGSPMDRSWRRHRAEKVPAYQRLSPYGRSRSRAQKQTEIS